MKLFKYFVYFSVFFHCGCSYADPKEKLPNLACPYKLPKENDFLVGWEVLGKIPAEKLQLRDAGIIYGNATEEKIRLSGVKNRIFSDEKIEEWEEVNGVYQAEMAYPEKHDENSLKCTYAKSEEDSTYNDRSVVLLIPLPPNKAMDCLFIKRNIDPTVEASCKLKK